ncbi:hypothetical protein FPV67DRAFT_1400688, partial [Lyophyllum atratum]
FLLEDVLNQSGHSLADWPSMPRPEANWNAHTLNPLIAEQLAYDRDTEHSTLQNQLPQLNGDQ